VRGLPPRRGTPPVAARRTSTPSTGTSISGTRSRTRPSPHLASLVSDRTPVGGRAGHLPANGALSRGPRIRSDSRDSVRSRGQRAPPQWDRRSAAGIGRLDCTSGAPPQPNSESRFLNARGGGRSARTGLGSKASRGLAPPAPSRKGRPRGVVSAGSCRTLPKRATTFYDRFPTPGKKGARRSCRGGHDDCDVFILDRSRSTAGSHACPHGVSGGCRGRARGLT
jgi:hypothetical protein